MKSAIILLLLCIPSLAANDPTTQPVVLLNPPAGTIIENRTIKWQPGMDRSYGIYVNGSKNITIRNCKVDGFTFNVALTGGNVGAQIYQNILTNSSSGSTVDSSGLYTEGLSNYSIHDNVIANSGWWVGYDVNDPTQRTIANRHHGWYNNESYGTSDNGTFINNLVIDSVGSNVGSRKGGIFKGNVFRPGGDWDLILASLGGQYICIDNGFFAPRKDAIPYYGGGIHALGTGLVTANIFAGSAGITFNPAAADAVGVVIPQIGVWPKPGTNILAKIGQPVLTLEAYYHTADIYSVMQPGDAQKIIEWMKKAQQ